MNNAWVRVALRLPSAIAVPTTRPAARYLQKTIWPSRSQSDRKTFQLPPACFSTYRPCLSKAGRDPRPAPSEGEEKRAEPESAQQKVDDRPWMREDEQFQPETTSPDPPNVDKEKGRLLTTPTRLLKLILPMPFNPDQQYINPEKNEGGENNSKDVQPLALLVHPSQPLSYLERLIQAEVPPLLVKNKEKLPNVSFRAEADQDPGSERKGPDNVASYSGLGREGPDRNEVNWVRWSSSTEVGDFIRDAARGKEFAIDVEGYPKELRVAVPSFKDRTHYMRMRLRRMSSQITDMAKVKKECDLLAHQGAHRIAQGGFAALAGWWGIVYYVTFHTEMGWDLVEPVTYLAGLTTIMGGYLWFLYMSKDLSYKAAMNITVTRRQQALYQERGFDQSMWEQLVHEANGLRREIKNIATEYDVEWNEMKDLGDEEVKEALETERSDNDDDRKGKKNGQKDDKASQEKKE